MENSTRTYYDTQITTKRLNDLRNYIATKPLELEVKKQDANTKSLIFHLQFECYNIDRIIKNAKEYEKCNYLSEIEKGDHRRLCKKLNEILFDFENELIELGTERNINWISDVGFDFDLDLESPNQPIKQLFENHLEIAKEFEEFIKIERALPNETYLFDEYLPNKDANKLFNFLVKSYRPDEKSQVKFINILHFMKNAKDIGIYKLNIKQRIYTPIIKNNFGIEIKKYDKSPFYNEDEEPKLNGLKSEFIKTQS